MTIHCLKKKYYQEIAFELKEFFSYSNVMEIPRLSKIVINRGLGEAITNTKLIDYSAEQLLMLTGQKPVLTLAKKSVSNFKIREGQVIGCKVTLRSKKMYDFFTKLTNVALPKIRDFRGTPTSSFDGKGNYTLGILDDTIFPEILFDKVDKARGFDISFVTTATSDKEAFQLLSLMGMPFNKLKRK